MGPNYHFPQTIMPLNFEENRPEETFEVDDEDLKDWWSIFNDPFLDDLLAIAIQKNFDYRIALERVYQARSQYWIQFTQILPELDADSISTRYRASQSFANAAGTSDLSIPSTSSLLPVAGTTPTAAATTLSPFQNFFQVGLDAIWEIDLWGKLRRSADSSFDLWEATAEDMRGVKITMISEVANTYATICADQRKKNIAFQITDLDRELFLLANELFESGLGEQQNVETAQATWESDKSELAIIEGQLKEDIYSLAVLIGCLPEVIMEWFQEEMPIPLADGKVPVSLPSMLLRRRPDIRSAERQLAYATEQIGVSVAELFPTVSLTGSSTSYASNPLQGANVGYASDTFSKLFRPASLLWGIGAFATQPVVDFGKRSAAVDVQVALRNQSYYSYQKSVIAALQETETALALYFSDQKREQAQVKEVNAYWRAYSLNADLFQSGLTDYSQPLQSKRQWLISLSSLTDSQLAETSDLIAIYKALGGDW